MTYRKVKDRFCEVCGRTNPHTKTYVAGKPAAYPQCAGCGLENHACVRCNGYGRFPMCSRCGKLDVIAESEVLA